MIEKVTGVYFSPTGTTKEVVEYTVKKLSALLNVTYEIHSYTLPENRRTGFDFDDKDLVVWGTPVYAGRIPNKTLAYVENALSGGGSYSIPVVTFGNRSFDDGIDELLGIFKSRGSVVIGAMAVVANHVFSDFLAKGRPDKEDFAKIDEFCKNMSEKLRDAKGGEAIELDYQIKKREDLVYYIPKKENGEPARFLKAKPVVEPNLCCKCKKCVELCPMGSITLREEMPDFDGVCIKCQSCIKVCPTGALQFVDEDFLSHVRMLEKNFAEKKESVFFM